LLQLAGSSLPTLNWDESLLRLALAAVLGAVIGVERELREREAGLRTHLLVCLGYYSAAVITTLVVLVALWPLRILAYRILHRFRPGEGRLLVQLAAGTPPGALIDEVERLGARISSIEVGEDGDRRRLELDIALPRELAAPRLVAQIADVADVAAVRWE
jgi:uncharacterized membrane protein YhiD involved in acid resistance